MASGDAEAIEQVEESDLVEPLLESHGSFFFSQAYADCRVPAGNLVGGENKGWDCAKFLLGNERTGIARVGLSKERIRRIKDLAAKVRAR